MVQLLAGIISLRRVLEANPGRSHGSADTLPLRHSANDFKSYLPFSRQNGGMYETRRHLTRGLDTCKSQRYTEETNNACRAESILGNKQRYICIFSHFRVLRLQLGCFLVKDKGRFNSLRPSDAYMRQ